MSGYALELNDAEIVAWDATHELLRDSGYAYLGSSPWRFGAAAAASARLHPHDTLTAQYSQMGAPRIGATTISAAEVIYRQVQTWRAALPDSPGIWLTSGAASGAQLGTLLGIAQTAERIGKNHRHRLRRKERAGGQGGPQTGRQDFGNRKQARHQIRRHG